jgi:catechol 2,3-dioxygenase-like lactoylglutathione lyase family enzyme
VGRGTPLGREGRHPLEQELVEGGGFQQARPAGRRRVAQHVESLARQCQHGAVLVGRLDGPQGGLGMEGDAVRALAGRLLRRVADQEPAEHATGAGILAALDRPGVTDFVHIGLVVEDLDETVRFLELLGFGCSEPGVFSGEWIDQIIGLDDVTVETVMARAPDGTDMFEVVRFRSPSAGAQEPAPAANRPGLRHVAFKVDDVRAVVDRVREAGWDTVGEIVDYESMFLLCYVRGPEGLIVELAERL